MEEKRQINELDKSICFKCSWPFDWKTPMGYFTSLFLQSIPVNAAYLTAIIFFDIFLGSCWLFVVMIEDIGMDLIAFNNDVKANANRDEWKKYFCDILKHYLDLKQ